MKVHGLILLLVFSLVESLRPIENKDQTSIDHDAALRSLVTFLLDISQGRRLNHANLAKARGMYKKITKNMSKNQIRDWLRQAVDTQAEMPAHNDQSSLVETELKGALQLQSSAIYDRPYVEQSGQNDFLVMQPDVTDTFVTVIPNSMYYDIEKKCVNWLDDCSIKGIRSRLLRGVQGPFK